MPNRSIRESIRNASRFNRLSQDGYFIWGASVIRDNSGLYHIFASRWPTDCSFKSWLTASSIVRGTATSPEGPFTIEEEITSLKGQDWSSKMVHNPTIKKIKDRYYLFYVGTTFGPDAPEIPEVVNEHPARFNQRIGVAVADHPSGPWVPSETNPILAPRPEDWDNTFCTNPSIFVKKEDEILLVYKSRWHDDERLILGLAKANDPLGPYIRTGPSPIFQYNIEDPFIWKEGEEYWMLAKDMSGELVGKHNGALFCSRNAMDWQPADPLLAYNKVIPIGHEQVEEHPFLERPQLYIEDEKPICIYHAVGDYKNYSFNLARRIDRKEYSQ